MEMALVLMPCKKKHNSFAIKPLITHNSDIKKLNCLSSVRCGSGVLHRKFQVEGPQTWLIMQLRNSDIVIYMFCNICIYMYDKTVTI